MISDTIKGRLLADNKRFFANDNIAEYIESEEELLELQKEVEGKFLGVLESLVIDIQHDHNTMETAKRVAKMYVKEIFSGRYIDAPRVTSFPNASNYDGLYVTGPISIRSTCAHHFQNIVGKCWIGILPTDEVIGLSKFNRIVHHIAERPQIQEEMTQQIATALIGVAKTDHIAVVIKAEHHCMTHRGVREHESDMTTAIMKGSFDHLPQLRNEFYQIINNMKGMKC